LGEAPLVNTLHLQTPQISSSHNNSQNTKMCQFDNLKFNYYEQATNLEIFIKHHMNDHNNDEINT
jgi:hypothetical protein